MVKWISSKPSFIFYISRSREGRIWRASKMFRHVMAILPRLPQHILMFYIYKSRYISNFNCRKYIWICHLENISYLFQPQRGKGYFVQNMIKHCQCHVSWCTGHCLSINKIDISYREYNFLSADESKHPPVTSAKKEEYWKFLNWLHCPPVDSLGCPPADSPGLVCPSADSP